MRYRGKNLTFWLIFIFLLGTAWNVLSYPEELWIRYNFTIRSDEIDAIASYVEAQDSFRHFGCIEDEVSLDLQVASAAVREELQNHCRSSRINMGYKTDYGSFFPMNSRSWWFKNYMIALVHSPNLDDEEVCTRWRKLDPGQECVLRLTDLWAIHYWNAIFEHEDTTDLAGDVVDSLTEQ